MAILALMLFIMFPIVSLPLLLFLYIKDKKYRILYAILLGLVIGIINYYYMPRSDYDLYRHHIDVINYMSVDVSTFMKNVLLKSEPIQISIKYIVSLIGNKNLLQFFVTSVSFMIFFGILGDYAKRISLKTVYFIFIIIFTFTSINILYMLSGLWNQFAMLIFALGYYLLKIEKGNKIINYLIIGSTILIHSSMMFPIVIFLLFKIFREKVSPGLFITILILFLFPSTLIVFINAVSDIPIFSQIESMYNAYFLQNERFYVFYPFKILMMELAKLFMYFALYFVYGKDKSKTHKFCLILALSVLMLVINSVVFVRFIFLLQIVGSLFLMDYFKEKKPNMLIIIYMILCTMIFAGFQFTQLREMYFGNLFTDNSFKNLISIFNK